jgi:hypothetical protein
MYYRLFLRHVVILLNLFLLLFIDLHDLILNLNILDLDRLHCFSLARLSHPIVEHLLLNIEAIGDVEFVLLR